MMVSIQFIDELSSEYLNDFNPTVKIFIYNLNTLILKQPYLLKWRGCEKAP